MYIRLWHLSWSTCKGVWLCSNRMTISCIWDYGMWAGLLVGVCGCALIIGLYHVYGIMACGLVYLEGCMVVL